MSLIRRYFISGLLVWLPIWVTILVINFVVVILEDTLLLLPKPYQPDALLGVHVPGIGVLITLLIIFVTGMVAANFLGGRLVAIWEVFVGKIPLVRSIHASVKQLLQTIFTPGGQSFRKVLLVKYPHHDCWTLAFQTGDSLPDAMASIDHEPMISVYVPTTPNPTSGFILIFPKKDVIEIDMSIEQALKYVISLGVVHPNNTNGNNKVAKGIDYA